MSTEKSQPISAIKACEERYPETTAEFKKILKEQYELFCKKQMNCKISKINLMNIKLKTLHFTLITNIKRLKFSKSTRCSENFAEDKSVFRNYLVEKRFVHEN